MTISLAQWIGFFPFFFFKVLVYFFSFLFKSMFWIVQLILLNDCCGMMHSAHLQKHIKWFSFPLLSCGLRQMRRQLEKCHHNSKISDNFSQTKRKSSPKNTCLFRETSISLIKFIVFRSNLKMGDSGSINFIPTHHIRWINQNQSLEKSALEIIITKIWWVEKY